jgi:cell division protein FtsQ
MPLEMEDPDGDEPPRSKWAKQGEGKGHWWWPASTFGRASVGLGALIVLVAFGVVGNRFKTYLQRDARFRIVGASHIQAVGLTEVTRAQLIPAFGEDIGRNVFFVPLNERRKELEAIPWIQQATVMRLLPDQIRVDIVERKPVAFTRHGQQIGLVDSSGVLLDMAPAAMAAHHYSFPVLTGIDAGDKPASRQARMAVYQRMMSDLDSNGPRNSEQLSEIDLTDPEDARVLMPEQGADILAHFGEDHFLERYQRYKSHIAEWRQQYPNLSEVDLRYERQVVLEMTSGVSHAQTDHDQASLKTQGDATHVEEPGKPKSAAKAMPAKTGARGGSHNSAGEKNSKAKSGEKTPVHGSAKSKSNASKLKGASHKTAADKQRTANKTATQVKSTNAGGTATSNKLAAPDKAKQKSSPAARPAAAEGQ